MSYPWERRAWYEIRGGRLTEPTLAEAASLYARMGWPVFPLSPGSKKPAIRSCHPMGDPLRGVCRGGCGRFGHGHHDATTAPGWVLPWWRENPNYGIGIRTGDAFDVLDIDGCTFAQSASEVGVHFGLDEELDLGYEGVGPTVRTPNGFHLYYEPTGLPRVIKFTEHNDFLGGQAGYVVAPPTPGYSWRGPPTLRLRRLPGEVHDLIKKSGSQRAPEAKTFAADLVPDVEADHVKWSHEGLVSVVAGSAPGTRNTRLNWASFRLGEAVRDGKESEVSAQHAADRLVRAAIAVGLSEREATSTFKSGYMAGLRRPS